MSVRPLEYDSPSVRQACEMATAQLGCSSEGAMTRLQSLAAATNETVEVAALEVVAGSVRFDADLERDPAVDRMRAT